MIFLCEENFNNKQHCYLNYFEPPLSIINSFLSIKSARHQSIYVASWLFSVMLNGGFGT